MPIAMPRRFLNQCDMSETIGPKVPDLRGLTLRAVLEESAATGLPVEVQGDGMARAQDPPPGTILAPGSRVHVQLTR